MNEPDSTPMTDETVIARLRSALDEVHLAEPTVDMSVVPVPSGRSAYRWLAAAAAVALVVVGAVAFGVHRDRHVAAPAPDTTPTTAPTTPAPSTTIDLGLLKASWYRLDLPDFTAGAVHVEACCVPFPAPGPATVVAWGDVTGLEHGLLLLTATPHVNGDPTLQYTFSNMSQARASALEAKVVPGSGLPYVLDDPTMELLGSGLSNAGTFASQTYTSGGAAVTLTAGDYRDQLSALTIGGVWNPTSIAGVTGYRTDDDLGTTIIWHTPGETWATLHIDTSLARRIDEILGSLRQAPFPAIVPDTGPGDGQLLQGSATIIDTGKGPMLAWTLLDSLPPQGGDLPLSGFDWAQVVGEQTVNGTTWGGPYLVTGTWDGTSFVLRGPPTTAPSITLPPPVMTEGCTLATMAPMLDALGGLDYKVLHIISTSDWNYDGHCGVKITAAFDTPAIQETAAKVGTDVTLEFELRVVQDSIGPANVVVAHAVASGVGLDAAVWGTMLDLSKDIYFATSPESEAFVPGHLALAASESRAVSDELMRLRVGDELQWRWENGNVETLVVLEARTPPPSTPVPLRAVLLLQARAPDGTPYQIFLAPKP